MKQYVFVSDIDGTLLWRDGAVSPAVISAARAFQAAGGLLSLCTGRSAVAALPVAELLEVNCPCILYGGASLYDCPKKTHISTCPMPASALESAREVLTHCPSVSVQVLTDSGIYTLRRNAHLNARGVKAENIGPVASIDSVRGDVLKIVLSSENTDELASCSHFFSAETYHFAFASRTFIDIVAAGAGKADGLKALSKHLSIPLSQFFCAGDGMTDLPMLQLAGTSFAPENASDTVKAHVGYVVPHASAGGMELAFSYALQAQLREQKQL